MSTGKLITKFRPAHFASDSLYDSIIVVGGKDDPVDIVGLTM
jgi:hypothetical protein